MVCRTTTRWASPTRACSSTVAHAGAASEERVGEEVVEAPTTDTDDRHPGRTGLLRRVERELEVRCVLVGRVPLDHRPRGHRVFECRRRDGVDVADDEVRRAGRARARARGRSPRRRSTRRRAARRASGGRAGHLPANTSASIVTPTARGHADDGRLGGGSLRRHDPDQVLTVGGCVPTLSARRTGLPRVAVDPNPPAAAPPARSVRVPRAPAPASHPETGSPWVRRAARAAPTSTRTPMAMARSSTSNVLAWRSRRGSVDAGSCTPSRT